MGKQKQKSLKKLQEELLDLVKAKYYEKDEEISSCIDKINIKYDEMREKAEKRKQEKLKFGQVIKNIFVKISLATLQLCDKLIVKEKVSNQIMGYTCTNELANAEIEVKKAILKQVGDKE